MMRIILGSKSAGRQKVLREAGIAFEVAVADIDEKAIRHDDLEAMPLLIAHGKADALAARLGKQDALLVTADTVVVYRGELREKPQDAAEAQRFLSSYQADTPAWVNTGVTVTNLATGKRVEGFSKSAAYFETFSDADITSIIKHGYCMGCAGAFAVEEPIFMQHLRKLEGSTTGIIGLPIDLTQELLNKAQSI